MTARYPAKGMLIVLLCCGGCGGDDNGETYDDCRDGALSCFAPFVCRESPIDPGQHACLSPEGDVPACQGMPAGQEVPFELADESGIPLHWTLAQGCIPVSYSAEMAPRLEDIQYALDAWAGVECSRICFGVPNENEEPPVINRAERRLHFQMNDLGAASFATTNTTYENTTGRMISALVDVNRSSATTVTRAHLVTLVGMAVGLGLVDTGVESTIVTDNQLESPSTLDEEALCSLYGNPSYCGE